MDNGVLESRERLVAVDSRVVNAENDIAGDRSFIGRGTSAVPSDEGEILFNQSSEELSADDVAVFEPEVGSGAERPAQQRWRPVDRKGALVVISRILHDVSIGRSNERLNSEARR